MLTTLGIILSELITNAMKYVFVGREQRLIAIQAAKMAGGERLVFKNNGIVMPETINCGKSSGFGLQLVNMLVSQIHGAVSIGWSAGAAFTIEFPLSEE